MNSKKEVGVLGVLAIGVVAAALLAVPLVGIWLSSTVCIFLGAPSWAAVVLAVLLFPVLPLAWDAWANVRRRKRAKPSKRRMSTGARIMARVALLNALAIAAVLVSAPKLAFSALSTRGDWMLEGRSGPLVEKVRSDLFWGADRIEWLYSLAAQNRHQAVADAQRRADVTPTAGTLTATAATAARLPSPPSTASPVPAQPEVAPAPEVAREVTPAPNVTPQPEPDAAPEIAPEPRASGAPSPAPETPARPSWPLPDRPHGLVARIPPEVETDFASVAKYLADNEDNPFQRIRAIHDYVAQRIAYDVEGLQPGKYPSFDPKVVFDRRLAVCAGYANLLQAMIESIGGKSVIVAGYSREASDTLGNGDHAWNAVEIEGDWYLMDVTWDAGGVTSAGVFRPEYRSEYLFTPPEIFVQTHYPALPKWQLLEEPVSRGDFMRQPMLRPGFFASGLRLISPQRSQFSVDAPSARVVLSNTRAVYLAVYTERGGADAPPTPDARTECSLEYTTHQALIDCPLAEPGRYRLIMFGSDKALATMPFLGLLEVDYGG